MSNLKTPKKKKKRLQTGRDLRVTLYTIEPRSSMLCENSQGQMMHYVFVFFYLSLPVIILNIIPRKI